MEDPIFDPWCLGDDSTPTPPRGSRWRGARGQAPGVPVGRPVPTPRTPVPADDGPAAPTLSGTARLVSELLQPRLEFLGQRLSLARHGTTLDDRLAQSPPTLRFRIEPWRGPFDEGGPADTAVLEVVVERTRPERVAGRIWLDPLATAPTEEVEVAADALGDPWIETLLLDFVEKALRRA